ncbi:unnamed protein product [Diatraea saccharalis]|uniref:Uncharacterized protein n=1 Tax=Diatraea saccharalis TaxID=40085 RepID=A0A9N9R295_9NEOP|nr:unnamed protein product [Diatraea saccharalis]
MGIYNNHKYHCRGQACNACFSTIKVVQAYAVFEPHFRFFAREMMRLSGSCTLLWLTAYRNKWVSGCIKISVGSLLIRKYLRPSTYVFRYLFSFLCTSKNFYLKDLIY